jgi:uncharacterized protein
MNPDDLTKPLKPIPEKQRRRIFLPSLAGTVVGVLSGMLILFGVEPERGEPLSPPSVPRPALAQSVQQTAELSSAAPAMPAAKTISLTVIDGQTGTRRDVIVPATTNDQPEEGKPTPARSAAMTLADIAGGRSAAKSKRH